MEQDHQRIIVHDNIANNNFLAYVPSLS